MTSEEPPVHSKMAASTPLFTSALPATHQPSGQHLPWEGNRGATVHRTPVLAPFHSGKRAVCAPRGLAVQWDTPSAQPLTGTHSGQISPSLEDSASPCDITAHRGSCLWTVVKTGDNRGQHAMQQNQVPTTWPAQQGPGGSGAVASSFPTGHGETWTALGSWGCRSAGQAQLLSGTQQQVRSHENL